MAEAHAEHAEPTAAPSLQGRGSEGAAGAGATPMGAGRDELITPVARALSAEATPGPAAGEACNFTVLVEFIR